MEEQGRQESRIRQLLQDLLGSARVGDAPTVIGLAGPGMVATVRFDDGETETFLIGSREESVSELEVYSAVSPLGRALEGAEVGETRTYETPNGRTMQIMLQRAEPFEA